MYGGKEVVGDHEVVEGGGVKGERIWGGVRGREGKRNGDGSGVEG